MENKKQWYHKEFFIDPAIKDALNFLNKLSDIGVKHEDIKLSTDRANSSADIQIFYYHTNEL